MLCNRSVANAKAHIANLALAEIFEHAIRAVTIGIPVFEALFTCDDNHQRMARKRYDTALLLPAKACVNVEPPVVNATNLEFPRASFLLQQRHLLVSDFLTRIIPAAGNSPGSEPPRSTPKIGQRSSSQAGRPGNQSIPQIFGRDAVLGVATPGGGCRRSGDRASSLWHVSNTSNRKLQLRFFSRNPSAQPGSGETWASPQDRLRDGRGGHWGLSA